MAMLAAALRWSSGLLAVAVVAWVAAPARGAPLGLNIGDEITFFEFDALQNIGDGGSFDDSTSLFSVDGRITATNLVGSPFTLTHSNVDFHFDLSFISETLNFNALPVVPINITMGSPGGTVAGPDWVVKEAGLNILFGNFASSLVASANLDLTTGNAVFTSVVLMQVTGGDPNLQAALNSGILLQTATVFNFNPGIFNLVNPPTDNSLFDSPFSVSLSGTIAPLSSSPFVPEPSTAALFGGGLLGLLAVSRRVRKRGSSR